MADYLDTVEAQLARLTERGVDRSAGPTLVRSPRRHVDTEPPARTGRGRWRGAGGGGGPNRQRRREALVVVPALLIAVIVVVGLLAFGLGANRSATKHPATTVTQRRAARPHHRPTRSTTATTPRLPTRAPASATAPRHVQAPAGPVPPGFGPESFTAINTRTWWLLGVAPCSSPPCTSILRTDDSGQSFVGMPAPRTIKVSQLRFANAADGFAFNSQLWVTHDAGADWHQVRLGGAVTELATANGWAYAVVRYGHKGAGRLERAPLGSDTWTTLTGAGSADAGLWAHGSDVLLQSGGADLETSHDDGVRFTREAAPSSLPCDFEVPAAPVVWAHCATGTESATWRSSDFGAHFRPLSGPEPGLPNRSLFSAATARTAVVGYNTLLRTTDAGRHWSPVPGTDVTAWQYLGFTDASHGVAVGYVGSPTPADERLYYSGDGGATYHLVSIG